MLKETHIEKRHKEAAIATLPPKYKTLGKSQTEINSQARNQIGNAIYDNQWRKLSVRFRKDHPLCAMCLQDDRIEAATLVDHIIPVRVAPHRRMDETNLMQLCALCHQNKTKDDYTKFPELYGKDT